MRTSHTLTSVLAAGVLGGVSQAHGMPPAAIETVTIGNPGNAGDPQIQGIFGAVDHAFAMGKYEVTAGQYAAFLNAVAATDTYALYHENMWAHAEGCKIERTGSPGSHAYGIAAEWANRPVNFVSWGDAARFANWLHNGQPSGAQDLTTTEDGSYFLDGKMSDHELEFVLREPDATWVVPTENEWYKAAYHKNDGVTGNYWDYPTSTDQGASHLLIDPDPGNNATFSGGTVGNWTIGAPYYRTEVGAHENSASPYGTFDQGGNVQEFNETVPEPDIRGIRGGSWFWGDVLGVWYRPVDMHSSDEFNDLGFRVANVAPPSLFGIYCTAGTSASGCTASTSAIGAASATAQSGFSLTTTGVEGAKDGLYFFGTNGRQASPWGNGTSFKCVVPPVKRAGLLPGSGTSGACGGSFAQDLNALWCPSCPKPGHNPGAGSLVQAQLWYRDPQNTSNQSTSLSDGIEFSVTP